MHIKCIEISGFKSYRDKLVLDLDPRTNVIVGRNGTGKSNVFDAIRFVLGDSFGSIRADSRSALLHEGASERMMSASVTIHIDNSDGRLPVDAPTVAIARTVGLKKDEHFLNGKAVKRSDISNMLESAGFSRSNPYYIVAQGKIATLAGMSDAARLALLKEVAGTQVYEERRRESMDILNESEGKRQATQEVLDSIEARMRELEDESSQLAEFTALDRQRRAAEYVLYSAELAKATDELEQLTRSRDDDNAAATELLEALQAANQRVSSLEAEAQGLEKRVREATTEKSAAVTALPRVAQTLVRAEARRDAVQSRLAVATEMRTQLEQEIGELNARIVKEETRLREVLAPAAESAQAAYDALKLDMDRTNRRMESLIDRTSRGRRFRNKKERDAFISSSIADTRAHIAAQDRVLQTLAADAETHTAQADKARASVEKLGTELETARKRLAEIEKLAERAASARATAFQAKNDAYRATTAAEKALREATEAAEKAERGLHAATPPPVRAGLDAVRVLAESGKVAGIHGPLIDLFRPQHTRFNTAVDVVAGGALFNVIVETDDVAATVIDHLISNKAGRVTLVPLSRLPDESVQYPNDEDCRPLMHFLEFEPAFEKAVKQVFGRVLLCRSLEVASKYARSHGLTCVTLDGGLVNKKGALQGGFLDTEASRLVSVARMYEARASAEEAATKRAAAEQEALAAEQREAAARGEEGKLASEKARLRDNITRMTMDIERAKTDMADATRAAEAKTRERAQAEPARASLQEQLRELEAELASEMRTELTSHEERELEELGEHGEALKARLRDALTQAEAARDAEQRCRSLLADNLGRQLAEARRKLAVGSGSGDGRSHNAGDSTGAAQVDALQQELREITGEIAKLKEAYAAGEKELADADAELARANEQAAAARAALDAARTEAGRVSAQAAADTAQADKMSERRRDALRKKEECSAKLRDIGSLPSAEIDALTGKRRKELLALLAKLNDSLSKFAGVNKKAVEQFTTFSTERETLLGRAAELDKGDESIRSLIRALDARKDEAIMRTFKGVARHFKAIFSKLVPKGSAALRLITDADAPSKDGVSGVPLGDGAVDDEEQADGDDESMHEDDDVENAAASGDGRRTAGASSARRKRKSGAALADDAAKENAGSRRSSSGKAASKAAKESSSASANQDLRTPVERYLGVAVTASFTDATAAAEGRGANMSTLSGGQKALVALALIMAIQRADPAPFYLFDEIDAALDDTHRKTVAALIAEQARSPESPAQFILTTFRPEMVQIGDRFFGVQHQHKISTVVPQSKDDTLAFVHSLLAEESQVGTAATGMFPIPGSAPMKRAHMAASVSASDASESEGDAVLAASGGSRRSGSSGRSRPLAPVREEDTPSESEE